MPTLPVHIGRHLRAAREKAGLSQAEAARRTGIPAGNFSLWEVGAATPTLCRAFALADAYGTTLDQLLGHPYPASRKET